jgi:hypothetical protein
MNDFNYRVDETKEDLHLFLFFMLFMVKFLSLSPAAKNEELKSG